MMMNLLISGQFIVAAQVDEFVQNADEFYSNGVIYKRDIGFVDVQAEVPDGITPLACTFVDGHLVPPTPIPVLVPVPQEVSRRRGLRALFELHQLMESDIEAAITDAIANPSQRYIALSEFRTSQTFERHRALVVLMGHMLNLDLDALFIYAAKLA